MTILYNIGVFALSLGMRLSAFFGHQKIKKGIQGRSRTFTELQEITKNNKRPIAWFHAASLGEFEMGRTIIGNLLDEGKYFVLVSFFSPSGYENFKPDNANLAKVYLPFDTRRNAVRFLAILRPQKAIFLKSDFWFNMLSELIRRNVDSYIVSGKFRKNQIYFGPGKNYFLNVFRRLSDIFVVDKESFELLNKEECNNVHLVGDLRIDRAIEVSQEDFTSKIFQEFKGDNKLVLLGSSWNKEESLIANFLESHLSKCKVIIAPHEISKVRLESIQKRFNNAVLLSQFSKEDSKKDVLVIDSIGVLKYLYRYADFSLIGGGWTGALHNVLESVVYGTPVIFGPRFENNPEASELIKTKGGFSVSNQKEFDETCLRLLIDEPLLKEARKNARAFTRMNTGAFHKIYSKINF